ncbi:5'-AMP-activated protein kinase beta subunit, interation domain-containing protein, partial [Syncephalis pseudoplumigaleata]
VSTMITWNGGGHVVYVTGTFNRWRRKIKLLKRQAHRCVSMHDDDFTAVIPLPVGTHQLKFIVDDEWRCSDELATAPDVNGNLVNYITVDPEMLTNDPGMLPMETHGGESYPSYSSSPDGSYTSDRPAYLDQALQPPILSASVRRMQPPALPPHLEHVLLNNATVSRDDDSALPAPHHVELNHLYACSIRDGVMAMATTKRYREKVSEHHHHHYTTMTGWDGQRLMCTRMILWRASISPRFITSPSSMPRPPRRHRRPKDGCCYNNYMMFNQVCYNKCVINYSGSPS